MFCIFLLLKMSYALPSRALLLIRNYSRPMTRPDWRKSKPIITTYRLYLHVKQVIDINNYTRYNTLYHNVLYKINGTEWYFAYYYIKCYGLSCYKNDIKYNLKLDVDGLQDALSQFTIHDTLYKFI